MMDEKQRKALEKAVFIAGGQAALAREIRALGGEKCEKVQGQHVWNWLNRDNNPVPAECCLPIQRAARGLVKCSDLRPDLFNSETAA